MVRADRMARPTPADRRGWSLLDQPASACMRKLVSHGCFVDVKSVFDPGPFRKEGLRVWRL